MFKVSFFGIRSKFTVYFIVFGSLAGVIYTLVYREMERDLIENTPKKIAYYQDLNLKSPVLYLRDLDYKDDYINYFKRNMTGTFDFPLRTIPSGDIIYIRGYSSDSSLVEFYSPEFHGKVWGFTTGYLFKTLVHDTLKIENK